MRRSLMEMFRRRRVQRSLEAEVVLNNAILELQGQSALPKEVWSMIASSSSSSFSTPIRESQIDGGEVSTSPEHQRLLANALFQGKAVPRDEDRAWNLWKEAAERGDLPSKYSVAMGILSGKPIDLQKGATSPAEEACRMLREIVGMPTPSDPLEIETKANAAFALGTVLEKSGDEKASMDSYEQSARLGNAAACFRVGEAMRRRSDDEAARRWFERGGKDAECLHALSVMWTNGDGGPRDAKRGFRLATEAASAASCPPHVAFSVGNHYFHGMGTSRNVDQALEWWTKAADAGFVYAMINIGTAYRDGTTRSGKCLETARMWYVKAAERDSDIAKRFLTELDKKFPHVKRRAEACDEKKE